MARTSPNVKNRTRRIVKSNPINHNNKEIRGAVFIATLLPALQEVFGQSDNNEAEHPLPINNNEYIVTSPC